ncbi:MAG: NAD(P)H-hydrate dehydratase [candidate division WOR-3 bacterium]
MAIKVLTPGQMRQADELTVKKIGVNSFQLMENAGKSLAEEIINRFNKTLSEKRIAVFCGKGNNGGDGFVAARYLAKIAELTKVFILAKESEYKGDAAEALTKLKECGVNPIDAFDFLKSEEEFDIYIDAIFGTGFKGELEGIFYEVINKLNEKEGFKVSCDIPSGVNGETGEVANVAFKAHLTCTFAFPKTGLLLYPGRHFAGEIKICNIGIPENIVESNTYLLEKRDIKQTLPAYLGNEHKGSCGKVLIVAGSREYTGAAYLTAEACVNSGAGLTYLLVPDEIRPIMQSKLNEVIVISYKNYRDFEKQLQRDYNAIIFGPGLGRNSFTIKALKTILNRPTTMVIDADGIWALSQIQALSLNNVIITPHPGEASFLIRNLKASEIDKNRINVSLNLANALKAVVVLKGAPTVISNGEKVYINPTGNPGMAVGGMGDVLSGIIGAFLPRMRNTLQAACAGVYIHGLAADLLVESETFETITPTKVIKNLGKAFKTIYQ